jgi:predicted peptidase
LLLQTQAKPKLHELFSQRITSWFRFFFAFNTSVISIIDFTYISGMQHMNKLFITSASMTLLLLSLQPCQAQGWEKGNFHSEKIDLPYQLYTPEKSSTLLPLVIYLHGTGQAGTDNQAQLYQGENIGPDYFASPANQSLQTAYVLAPQTPMAIRWASTTLADYDFMKTPITASMENLLALIDKTVAHYPIDKNRIYLAGLSRGGQGVWYAALLRPDYFAAIVPIAGAGSPAYAQKLIKLPTWVFHGTDDQVTDVNYSRNMVDSIIKKGGSTRYLRYTEIEGGDHESSWLTAHKNSDLWKWMFKQNKSNRTSPVITK